MAGLRVVLCPVDLSDSSRRALAHAVVLARWNGARLAVLHVYQPMLPPVAPSMVGGWQQGPVPPSPEELKALRADVSSFCASLDVSGVTLDVDIREGNAAAEIVDAARRLPADLIVIGTHGHGAIERFLIGSVAEKVLHRTSCPVLAVPPQATGAPAPQFARILCAVDFSDPSLLGVQLALSLAEQAKGELALLHVIDWPTEEPHANSAFSVPEYRLYREEDALQRLKAMVSDDMRRVCKPVTIVRGGPAYREILAVARERGSDLIVMGVHGHGIVERLFVGSTANHVIRASACPVLTVRRQ